MIDNRMGRPSYYGPILDQLSRSTPDKANVWVVVSEQHKTRNAPSALRRRYPGFDFKATPQANGKFMIEARKL